MENVTHCKGAVDFGEQIEVLKIIRETKPVFTIPKKRYGGVYGFQIGCLGYYWDSFTWSYHKTHGVIRDGRLSFEKVKPIPDKLQTLGRSLLVESGYDVDKFPNLEATKPFDILLVNVYNGDSQLELHQDLSETKATIESGYPVVTLSIGAQAFFSIGPTQKDQEVFAVNSGDVVVFGDSARKAYHGINSITPGTAALQLGLRTTDTRVSLTFRVL